MSHSAPPTEGVTTPPDLSSTAWHDWLAHIGYGVDMSMTPEPPCTLTELAEAYHRMEPDTSAEDWAWCITQETGAFGGVA